MHVFVWSIEELGIKEVTPKKAIATFKSIDRENFRMNRKKLQENVGRDHWPNPLKKMLEDHWPDGFKPLDPIVSPGFSQATTCSPIHNLAILRCWFFGRSAAKKFGMC